MRHRSNFHPAFVLYFFVWCVELAAQLFTNSTWLQTLHPFAKALLMPLLIYGVVSSAGGGHHYLSLLYTALILSWTGDVLLLFQNQNIFFTLGLAAFLAAHTCYIFLYRKIWQPGSAGIKWLAIGGVAAYAFILLWYLWPSLHSLRVPVILYAITISTMLATAFHLRNHVTPSIYKLVVGGSILFVVSDSILAIHRFKTSFASAGFLVMLTYGVAQYLIAQGVLRAAHRSAQAGERAA